MEATSFSQSLFRIKNPEQILKKNLYDYRKRVNDEDFHFTLGIALLQMGFLYEAYLAFSKAVEKGDNPRNILFQCVTLMNAERYDECKTLARRCPWTEFNVSQLSVYIEILERLGKDTKNIEAFFRNRFRHSNEIEERIVYALYYAKKDKEKAGKLIHSILPEHFASEEDYYFFLSDCYTAGMPAEFLKDILKERTVRKISLIPLLNAFMATDSFLAMSDIELDVWISKVRIELPEQELGLWSRVWGVLYEIYERKGLKAKQDELFLTIDRLYKQGARDETGMLAIVIHLLRNFNAKNAEKIRNILSELIERDNDNMLFRKYLYELMLECGHLNEAEKLNADSINIRRLKDKEIFSLLSSFRHYYGQSPCPLISDDEKCPLCLGTKERPEFKIVCANVSPREIYTAKYISQTISIKDEETMKKVFDWQPVHVASPIVGEYLKSLGAYQTRRDFPDVLVEGETYVFIRFRKEAIDRLIHDGYSINQIEPLFSVIYPSRKPDLLHGASMIDKETNYKGIVSANDFILEIIRAVSPESC